MAELQAKLTTVRANTAIPHRRREAQLNSLNGQGQRLITNHSYWWGRDGLKVVEITLLPSADLAVGRLDPIPPDMVEFLPTIKDPTLNMDPGRSLCRLGFPFARPEVTYDEAGDAFALKGNFSLFPLDGIFTRTIRSPDTTPGGAPIQYIETSSAGLRGQSGGPVFDVHGRLWGIQSKTTHIPLGFNPEIEVNGRKVVEHQFINLGWAVHASTLKAMLDELGIAHSTSPE